MTVKYYYREGDTEPIDINLLDGTTAANITGYTKVSLFLRSEDGGVESEAHTTNSGITVTTASTGAIQLHPSLLTTALLFTESRYFGYIGVWDANGKKSSFPNGDEFEFIMKEKFAGDG